MSGCAFSSGFDSGFEICVAVAPTTKGRRPRRISIAAKSIDLLALPLDDLVETHILLAGSISAAAVTYPALALVEHTSAGLVVAVGRTHPAAARVEPAPADSLEWMMGALDTLERLNDLDRLGRL